MSARAKFSIMMFLQFFIWGAWFPLAYDYLTEIGYDATEKGWIMNAFGLSALVAMFFSTQFVDRTFAAEKYLALSHVIGGIAMLVLSTLTFKEFTPFFLLLLLHCLFYVPTISITNSIAFANLPNPQDDFGKVRLWGTIGWIAASVPFVFILTNWDVVPSLGDVSFTDWLRAALDPNKAKKGVAYINGVSYTYVAAGVASLVLAAFSLTLPHTPPKPVAAGEDRYAWLKAARLLKNPFLLVLFIATFFDAAVHQGFFLLTPTFLKTEVGIPASWIMPVMSIGQIAEILTMAVLGLALKKLGWRTTMIVGILGHTARFLVFAFLPEPAPAIAVNVLHGICYAFFFATVYIFVDATFPKDARASAQGLFNLQILGLGFIVANFTWPQLESMLKDGTRVDYQTLFTIPAIVALGAALLLLIFFHPPQTETEPAKE